MLNLSEHWRVAHDPRQWILQHRIALRWRDRCFCVTRAALERCIREHVGEGYMRLVSTFPERHPDRMAGEAKASKGRDIPDGSASELLPVSEAAGGANVS